MIAPVLALPLLLSAVLPIQGDPQDPIHPIQDIGHAYVLTFAQGTTPEEGMTLAKFVEACNQVTDINFTYTNETALLLEGATIRLLGSKEVPKTDFYSFFQIMMIINDFVCSRIGPDHLSVVLIESLKTGARNTVKADAVHVSPDELDNYADQPATLITTVIHLPNTDARALSNAMRTMLTDANTQQMLPAGNTHSMILTGFGSNVAALARMLTIIDEASIEEVVLPEFEVIPLEFASADELAGTIEELLDASQRAVSGNRGQQPAQGATAQLQRGRTETKIMVQPSTNSLLVMAMPEDMPRIKQLIARLDIDIIERERNYHIVSLENVDAQTLSDTLNEFLQDAARLDQQRNTPQAGQGRAGGGGSNNGQEFVVVPDTETNSLLIAASATRYQELFAMIERLDQRQDQVLIETALIELTGSDMLDIGAEISTSDIPGIGNFGGLGASGFGLSEPTVSETTLTEGVLRTIAGTPSGLTAGIIDNDNGTFGLPLLIQLTQQRDDANVLNVPSVLVNNNGSARVVTLDEEPTTEVTLGTTGGGTQRSFSGYVDAGITMQISPSISASNYLRLNVFLEVSNFTGATVDDIPPPKRTRTIETSVNVPDGDTMVIGGLVLDNTRHTRNQVPWLGDLPVLGLLFSRDVKNEDRTTLYFFVTPHIMRDSEFADLAELSYRKKLEAADRIGADRVRQIDPDFGRGETAIDLEGFDVPIYTSPERGEIEGDEVGLDPATVSERLDDADDN
jgi:general secretion pathway protein D